MVRLFICIASELAYNLSRVSNAYRLKNEGLLRDYRKNGDEYWNLWEMGILENEWQHKKINS